MLEVGECEIRVVAGVWVVLVQYGKEVVIEVLGACAGEEVVGVDGGVWGGRHVVDEKGFVRVGVYENGQKGLKLRRWSCGQI
tara:strand:+ start:5436 stop:5681 length:246 start_codon:yes stop_codon:yes gene_type:complete